MSSDSEGLVVRETEFQNYVNSVSGLRRMQRHETPEVHALQ
jgi:hypothetical protein